MNMGIAGVTRRAPLLRMRMRTQRRGKRPERRPGYSDSPRPSAQDASLLVTSTP